MVLSLRLKRMMTIIKMLHLYWNVTKLLKLPVLSGVETLT